MEPPPGVSIIPVPASSIVSEKQAKLPREDPSATTAASTVVLPTSPLAQPKQHERATAKDDGAPLPPPPPKMVGGLAGGGSKRQTAASASSYKPPSWGLTEAPNASGLSLTVLKGGVEVISISLDNRTHFLLGRQQGVVDVLLEHPSISRKHAILQHGQNGALFLFDNGSTHGCMVNKEKIPSKEFHRLHVGDVIKFGESTRLYALEGPDELKPAEYESENLRNLRLDAGRKQLVAKLAKLKADAAGEGGRGGGGDSGEYGISWGFDEDAIDEEEDEDEDGEGEGEVELPDYLKTEAQKRRRRDTKVGLTEDSVHKRDNKLFEKLQLKLNKVEHLLTENERITAKEGGQGGLTEGQQAQLARNDKAITAIRLQIEEIEETIRSKNKARERSKEGGDENNHNQGGGGGEGGAAEYGEEEDDYYDRTAPIALASSSNAGSDPVSKKAEIRARRFGGRDKTKKLSAMMSPGDGSAAAVAGSGGGPVGGEPAAQSLEALTRRAEVVTEDLERAEAGLVELEAEEAEEVGGEDSGGVGEYGRATADPLDMFMTENRKKERQQAMQRLTSKRESLLEEQARLRRMVEAARPSLPSLKRKSAPAPAAAVIPAAKEGVEQSGIDSAEDLDVSPSDQAAVADGIRNDTDTASDRRHVKVPGGNSGGEASEACRGSGVKADEKDEGEQQPPRPTSTVPAPGAGGGRGSMSEPAALPRQSTAVAEEDRKSPAGEKGRGTRGESGQGVKQHPTGNKAKVSGAKRRGTPVGALMLPPPPSKRQQRREESLNASMAREEGEGEAIVSANGANAKRTVKGPAPMPSPSGMPPPAGKPSAVRAGASGPTAVISRGAGSAVSGTDKDVLEGGDVDWVPPKGALEKMAALNQKFGY